MGCESAGAALGSEATTNGAGPAAGKHRGQLSRRVSLGKPSSVSTTSATPPAPAQTNCVRVGCTYGDAAETPMTQRNPTSRARRSQVHALRVFMDASVDQGKCSFLMEINSGRGGIP